MQDIRNSRIPLNLNKILLFPEHSSLYKFPFNPSFCRPVTDLFNSTSNCTQTETYHIPADKEEVCKRTALEEANAKRGKKKTHYD